uniref:CARMIL C-terminal domain-containing protein n=1 Tax=Astyanax mexicanus TaxID=7994 RepID=A0A8B9L4I0_ASTMX
NSSPSPLPLLFSGIKSEKLESRILVKQTFNFFDIQSVSSNKSNQLVLEYDKGQLSVKLSSNEEVDEVIAQIGSSIQEHCPGLNPVRVIKKLSLKPAERVTSLQTLWENNTPADTGPCGAFSRMYWCLCDQQGFPYREEVQWDVDTIYLTQDTRELNLQDFIHLENSLQTLDLSSCDCSLDLVCSSLLRGSLKHLSVLNMSKSVFNLKRGKELPSSFKQFFNNAQALNTIILSGTKLPLEALKALLLGLASNPNLKDISLDLSSCEVSFTVTLRDVYCTEYGVCVVNLGQVLSSLVLMIQEEESPLSSLSLADSKLKADLSIVLNAVGGNSSLTRLDISGNSMGDMGAKMLAKALQINTKLRTVIWDRNNVSAQGLQDVAAALEKNYTIRFMPMPIMDAALALKSSPEKTEDALMKMEQYLLRNHETRKYLQEQAYRLQQGIVTSTTQQMIDRLCVKVQDHLNSLRFSEREIVQEDMKAAEKLVQDARNSKRVSPWAGPIQEELQSMVGEISTVIDQQLQSLLVSMVDTAESVCPHVMRKANLRPALMRASEGKMSVPQSFITDTLLKQSAVDIINKISEVKLSLASFLSDRIIDEILASLSRSQQRLAEHLSRRGQPLLHHDSEETEVVDETNLLPENLPAPPDDLLVYTHKHTHERPESVVCLSVYPLELEFDLDKALEHVPIHLEDLPLPLPPTPVEAELVRQRSVGLSDLPETESPKLQHITKQRPRRKKTALRRAAPVEEVELESLVGKVDEGVDEFFSKKVTKIGGERKRESRMSGFFNLIKSRTSTKTPPTSPHTPSTAPASVTPTTTTPIVTTKAGPCDHGEIAAAPEPKAQAEEGKKKEGAPAGRIRRVQVMGNDFLAQLRAKQEKLKEKVSSVFNMNTYYLYGYICSICLVEKMLIHCIAKSIHSPIQINKLRFHSLPWFHRYVIKSAASHAADTASTSIISERMGLRLSGAQ